MLIGEAGVGKTAIVEGLAQHIVSDEVPQTLSGKRVVQLELSGVVAGTRYRGDFEQRLKSIIDEVREHSDELIVFIDELHTLVGAGAGAEGGINAGNMVKPALARGELHVVGATTLDEYRRASRRMPRWPGGSSRSWCRSRRAEDARSRILRGLRDRYEAHHQVRYADEALVAAVEMSDRYITDRYLPDKAIDLIDQSGARVRLRVKTPGIDLRDLERQAEELSRDKDQAVASEQSSRPRRSVIRSRSSAARSSSSARTRAWRRLSASATLPRSSPALPACPSSSSPTEEKDRLLGLERYLHERVIGQDEAVSAVAEAVRRSRAGLGDPNRPVGSFLFLGPTGVGKTELARALTEALFGADSRMIRLDMSEFQERHTVRRLVGAPTRLRGLRGAPAS